MGGPPVRQPRPCAIPTTQSPTIEARRFDRWRYATNYGSMDALSAREVQFFVKALGFHAAIGS